MSKIAERTKETDALTNKKPAKLEMDVDTNEDFQRLRQAWVGRLKYPTLVHKDDAPLVQFPGQAARVLLNGDQSGGVVSVFHLTLDPGYHAPHHHQPNEEEFFFVIQGEVELTIGNETRIAGPGSFGFAPRCCTHAFKAVGTAPAQMLTWNIPAGHERMFEGVQRLT